MSWLDELSDLERRAKARLLELEPKVAEAEPLLAEYREVRQLVERLGAERSSTSPRASATAAPGGASTATAPARRRRSRAPKAVAKPTPASAARVASTEAAETPAASKPAPRRPAARKPSARRPAANTAPKRGGRRDAAKPGEREGQLLALVRERPGITVPEAAGQLGVDATGLYAIVRRLQSRYQVIKDGTALHPAGAPAESTTA
jgi:hypothetical protein